VKVANQHETSESPAAPEPLAAVAETAGERLRAQTNEDADATRRASEVFMSATMAAMNAGYSLREITAAEERGKNEVRSQQRGETLKSVDRAARQLRDAEGTYRAVIARAVRLGLSTREIAQAAHVTHGTIRAIAHRLAPQKTPTLAPDEATSESKADESSG